MFSKVLLFGAEENAPLAGALRGRGITTRCYKRLPPGLQEFQRHQVAWALVRECEPECDALETVINIRDLDEMVPVAVITDDQTRPALAEALSRFKRVHLVSATGSIAGVADRLAELIERKAG